MVFSTSCRATSNLCRDCAAGQSRGLQTLNRGILHSPVKARTDELAQIRAAAAAENLRQVLENEILSYVLYKWNQNEESWEANQYLLCGDYLAMEADSLN